MADHYILDENKRPVKISNLAEWSAWMDTTEKRVVAQDRVGESFVSTVFLGVDHDFSIIGNPILFETIIFGGKLDGELERYHTYEEAKQGHAEILARLKQI